jgi:hypothetical protein
MGISYDAGTETITVTGGSFEEPYTMAILDADGTVGGYISAGGYGNREYTVNKNLVIGSADDWTFFDPTRSIVKMADGYNLTVYSHALRGGRLRDSWAAVKFGAEKGPIEERECNLRTEGIIKMYPRMEAMICPNTGDVVPANNPIPVLNPSTLGQPLAIEAPPGAPQVLTEWDPCAVLRQRQELREASRFVQLGGVEVGPSIVQSVFEGWPEPVPATAAPEATRNPPKLEIIFVLADSTMVS